MRSAEMIELWRGDMRESLHAGHAVICDAHGVVEARTALLAHALLKDLAEDVSEVHGGLPFMM